MNEILILKLVSFAAGVSILTAVGQLVIKNKGRENYNLSCLFITMGFLVLQDVFVLNGYASDHQYLTLYHAFLMFCLGPLLYVAYYTVVNPDKDFPQRVYVLFIPAILVFIFETIYFFIWNTNHLYLSSILTGSSLEWPDRIMLVILVVAFIQSIIYHIYLLAGILPLWDWQSQNKILNITVIVSSGSLTSVLLLLAGYISGNHQLLRNTALFVSVCLAAVYLVGQRYPHFLQLLKTEVSERRYKKYLLAKHDVKHITVRLIELMEKQNLYRDDHLSLKSLAESLDISAQQLSQLLNDTLQTNFHNFINRYRIREAESILVDNPDRPILSIAFEVGFNTKSSFYDAFSRFTGKTPLRYREDMKKIRSI